MSNSETQNQSPLLETSIGWLDKLIFYGQIGLMIFIIIKIYPTISGSNWGEVLFFGVFLIIWFFQSLRRVKTFHLFQDSLVIRRPFFFNIIADKTFKIEDLKAVIFRRVEGRFGGPHLIINSKEVDDSFRIDFDEELRNNFVVRLRYLGVNVSVENM